jgi:hypothetical protein
VTGVSVQVTKIFMSEIYVSTDIEADGPIPGVNSMLSFGSAAFKADKTLLGTFSANLKELPGAVQDKDTMKFWAKNPEAWQACRQDQQDPAKAMKAYVKWLKKLPGKPVFTAYPAGFDFTYVYWYLMRFAGTSPFSFSALDIKTYAMAMLKKDFHWIRKKHMPERWFDVSRKSHVALDDAMEQGLLFCNMLAENKTNSY